jgi:hypothetical protein
MREFLPFILLIIFISSCSHYQYVTIDASDLKRTDKQEFVEENDSVRIQYSFDGPDAPINLIVENKTDAPIFIDWSRSALIINDKAISYMSNVVPIEGTFNGSAISWNHGDYAVSSGSISATATLPANISFIPPKSYINKTPMSVTNQLMTAPDSAFHTERITLYDGYIVKVRHAVFTEQSSPLRFKSYLTITFGDQDSKTLAYQRSFYISEVYDTPTDPETFLLNRARSDQFYVRESSGIGQGFGVVAGIALLSTAAALETKSVNHSNR